MCWEGGCFFTRLQDFPQVPHCQGHLCASECFYVGRMRHFGFQIATVGGRRHEGELEATLLWHSGVAGKGKDSEASTP